MQQQNPKPLIEKIQFNNSVYLPVAAQQAVGIEKGDHVRIRVVGDTIVMRKAIFIEDGDKSDEAMLAYVSAALRAMDGSQCLLVMEEAARALKNKEASPHE